MLIFGMTNRHVPGMENGGVTGSHSAEKEPGMRSRCCLCSRLRFDSRFLVSFRGEILRHCCLELFSVHSVALGDVQ